MVMYFQVDALYLTVVHGSRAGRRPDGDVLSSGCIVPYSGSRVASIVLICVTGHRAMNCHETTIVFICVTVHRAMLQQNTTTCKFTTSWNTIINTTPRC